jgi:hypothetical protein
VLDADDQLMLFYINVAMLVKGLGSAVPKAEEQASGQRLKETVTSPKNIVSFTAGFLHVRA